MRRSCWSLNRGLQYSGTALSVRHFSSLNLDSLAKTIKTKPQVMNRQLQHAQSANALLSEASRSLKHLNAFHLILFFHNLVSHRDAKDVLQLRKGFRVVCERVESIFSLFGCADEVMAVVAKSKESLDLFKKPVQLARLIYGVCKLQVPKEEVESFVRAWSEQVMRENLVSFVFFSKKGGKKQKALPRLREFNEVELSNTILALGKMRCGVQVEEGDFGLLLLLNEFSGDWVAIFH
jgi:transcriptional regulator NrdR family protein